MTGLSLNLDARGRCRVQRFVAMALTGLALGLMVVLGMTAPRDTVSKPASLSHGRHIEDIAFLEGRS